MDDTSLDWWDRTGTFVPYPELHQQGLPHCVYAAVAGAVNHVAGQTVWTPTSLFAECKTQGLEHASFEVADIALHPVKSHVEKHHHHVAPTQTPLGASWIRQWLDEGGVVVLSMEVDKNAVHDKDREWHMFTIVACDHDQFQVWDSNGFRGYITADEIERGFPYPGSRRFKPHAKQDALVIRPNVAGQLQGAGFDHIDEEALAARDWWSLISRATSTQYRECFDVVEPFMTDDEYATTVREMWVATDGLPPAIATHRLIEHGRMISQLMWMREDDAQTFTDLPDLVTVYRGCRRGNERGWSWTLNRDTAEHFALGLQPDDCNDAVIVAGTVAKASIIALFSGEAWAECEVIVPADRVNVTATIDL